jgi:hypothetical protein
MKSTVYFIKSLKIRMIFLISCLIAVIILDACKKRDNYPDTPQIKYLGFTKIQNASGIDDKGIMKLSFTDGDGNIGLAESDTFPPYNSGSKYYYNFFIDYYEKQKGVWKLVDLAISNNARIPPVTGTGPNNPTKGEIEIELYFNNYQSAFDTIAFESYIVDRDLNESNKIRTSEIIVKKH